MDKIEIDSGQKEFRFDVDEFCDDMDLQVIYCNRKAFYLNDKGTNRPGLQLHGYYEYFDENRIQMVGMVETSYLLGLSPEVREQKIDEFFAHDFPCLIVCWDMKEADIFLPAAKKYNRIVLRSAEKTTRITHHLGDYIDRKMAPMISIHGVLVEVHGVGVLIKGSSGIGKSETALELIKRGNTLIADDMVEVRCFQDRMLVGTAPEMLRYYMEVRGIGIINARTLYGAKSVKEAVEIELIINLENWNEHSDYDRLGLDEQTENILGVEVPLVTVPVSGGRNLAVIIETAAINNRMKLLGYHSAQIFCDRIEEHNIAEAERIRLLREEQERESE